MIIGLISNNQSLNSDDSFHEKAYQLSLNKDWWF